MVTQEHSMPAATGSAVAGSGATAAPPDLNKGKYSFEVVQHKLDQAAYLNMIAVPDQDQSGTRVLTMNSSGSVFGISAKEILHRFDAITQVPTAENGMRALNVVGQPAGELSLRWMIIPDDYVALPDQEPPATRFDASRSQRFVMRDNCFRFGADGFYGFGTGRTHPVNWGGKSMLLAGAVGNITRGFGNFEGLAGTYVFTGSVIDGQGFKGNITVRVFDPAKKLRQDIALPALMTITNPEPGVTYIVWRGQKKDATQKSSLIIGPDGQPQGLRTPAELRSVHLDFATRHPGGLRTVKKVGEQIGKLDASILFNPLNPGAPGTAAAPIPFQTRNKYVFTDRDGHTVGTVSGFVSEGRVFKVDLQGLPGQLAIRFGGFGFLEGGTGSFSGIEGMLAVNSSVGIAPHALSLLQWMRINDPDGRFRAVLNGERR